MKEERRQRVSENKVLRRIYGPKRDEVRWEWRKLYNEELNDLYSSPSVVWVKKSRRMRLAGHVARMEKRRRVYRVLGGNIREGGYLGEQGVGGRIILRWIFRKWGTRVWTGSSWLMRGTVGGHL